MALTLAEDGRGHMQLSNSKQNLAWKQQVSRDVHYGRRHGCDDVAGPPGGKLVHPPFDCCHINNYYSTANPVRGLASLPHAALLDTMAAASSQGMTRGHQLLHGADDREAENKAWSAARFQKSRGQAQLWSDLQETFEEITGRKQAYPGGWAEIEADPQAHLKHGSGFARGGGSQPWETRRPTTSSPDLRLPSRGGVSVDMQKARSVAELQNSAHNVLAKPDQSAPRLDSQQHGHKAHPSAITQAKQSPPLGLNLRPPGNKWRFAGGPSAAGYRHMRQSL